MGVTVLHAIPENTRSGGLKAELKELQVFPESSRAGCLEHEKLHKRIMHLDAQQCGLFTIDCDTYYTTAQTGGGVRKMHIVHNSETPATTYAILDTGTKQVTLSADDLFDLLLPRLDHMYQSKKNLKIESKGAKYEIGDFVVKIGTVTMSGHYKGILVENLKIESKGAKYEIGDFVVKIGTVTMSGHYKGILVEVEYLPCVTPALCWTLIREFMQSFMGSCVKPTAPTYLQNRFHDIHTPQDTVQQYVEKFNEFRDGFSSSQNTTQNT